MKRSVASVPMLALGLGLAGCAGPSAAQVEERFLIEYAGTLDYPIEIVERNAVMDQLAQTLAADAAGGACGDEEYYATLEADVEYAFGVTCSMYYEGQMSTERVKWVKLKTLDRVADKVGTD